uniref:B3 domain-containing protein REM10-like n=1 Tax=Erigeron canadensis TaxID=72917 RepID=UPI001CB8D29E|nr:B3 domain-containing protein REM10-like [Erigeron canadensis]
MSPPSFFMMLLDPLAPHLALPPEFVKRYKIPKDPILKSANGGYLWRLKMQKIGKSYCFSDGWDNVVQDLQLQFGDFLVFWLVDKSTFKVSIFNSNGCEKDVDDGNPFFMTTLTKSQKNVLWLPAEFVELTGVNGKKAIILKNLDGEEWKMSVQSKTSKQQLRYYLSSNWLDFQLRNELFEGDECVFKFIRSEDKLCLAKVTKNQSASRISATEVLERM